MGALIKFEFVKLYKKKINLIIFWGTCAMMVIFAMVNALQTWTWDKEGNMLRGLDAIKCKKEMTKELEGSLTNERAKELIMEFMEVKSNPANIIEEEGDWHFVDAINYSYYSVKRDILYMIAHNYDAPWENTWGGNLTEIISRNPE